MAQSVRLFYGRELGFRGRVRLNYEWNIISPLSAINVTAAEAGEYGSTHLLGGQNFCYKVETADVWVSNVSPHKGGVEFVLHVDSGSPVNVAVTITVAENVATFDRPRLEWTPSVEARPAFL